MQRLRNHLSLGFVSMTLVLTACGQPEVHDQRYIFTNEKGMTESVDATQWDVENRTADISQPMTAAIFDPNILDRLALVRPKVVDWRKFQTPIRNQMNRNTCSGFAKIAAIEARYMRDFDQNLDLSEQYFWHTYKSTGVDFPRKYLYENQSSFWGGGNGRNLDTAKMYAIPLETDVPYRTQGEMEAIRDSIPAAGDLEWRSKAEDNKVTQAEVDAFEYSTQYIPLAARQNARYGVKSYVSLDSSVTQDTEKLEQILATGHEVIVDVNLKWKLNATTGIMEWDDSRSNAWHVFLIVGYDSTNDFFWVKNSWGEADFRKVSYDFMRKASNGGSYVTEVQDPEQNALRKGRMLGVWAMDHDGWEGKLIIRRATKPDNDATRLGHYFDAQGKAKVVNGFSINDGRGVEFSIDDALENKPGTMEERRFIVNSYSWNGNYAAGSVQYSNKAYGTFLTRTKERSAYARDFNHTKWIGDWAMNHDGWKGTLSIDSFKLVDGRYTMKASYKNASGQVKAVKGTLQPGAEHIANVKIELSEGNPQEFTLYYHTWTSNLFSGSTEWSGKSFGVHAFRI